MKCPVCPAEAIAADAKTCPACGTDLLPVKLVREVGARYFNRALHLAVQRKHRDAVDSMLVARTFLPPSVSIVRVLGKMLWAAGDPTAAVNAWREGAAAYPDDEETRALLTAAERQKRRAARPVAPVAIAILATAVVSAAIFGFIATRPSDAQAVVRSSPAPVVLGSSLSIVPPSSSPQPAQKDVLQDLTLELESIDGLQIAREGGSVTVVFTGGMFDSASTVIRPADGVRLRRVATAIAAEPEALRIVVRGHADAASPPARAWRDNWSLALDRAAHALDVLRDAAGSGERIWLASGSTPVEGPFANALNPALNRTISLTVSPE